MVNDGDTISLIMTATATSEVTGVTLGTLSFNESGGATVSCGAPSQTGDNTVNTGDPVVYQWTCTVTAAGTPPSSKLSFSADASGTATISGQPVTWASAASNSVLVIPDLTFQVTVDDPFTTGEAENTASVQDTSGAIPSTDSNTVLTKFGTDLKIIKTASIDPAQPGGTLTYLLTVDNNGPGDASDVVVVDVIPTGAVLQSATASQGTVVRARQRLPVIWAISTTASRPPSPSSSP